MRLCARCVGVQECTFRIDDYDGCVALGIVPADKIDAADPLNNCGYVLYGGAGFYYPDASQPRGRTVTIKGARFMTGGTITVRADLDACKISFKTNDHDVGTPQNIASGTYYFVCGLDLGGSVVSVVERQYH